jgi:hypothetical protein
MRNYLRIGVALAAALLFTVSIGSVQATESRLGGMGDVGAYTHDDANIFLFPGAVGHYAGLAVGEMPMKNEDGTYTLGLNYAIGDMGVLGVHLNRAPEFDVPDMVSEKLENVGFNRGVNLFFARKMGEAMLGARLGVTMDSYTQLRHLQFYDQELGDNVLIDGDYKESTFGLQFGAGMSSKTYDVAAHLIMPSAKIQTPALREDLEGNVFGSVVTDENKWSGSVIRLAGRMFFGEDQKLRPVVVGSLATGSTKTKHTPPSPFKDPSEDKFGAFDLMLGVGAEAKLSESNFAVIGVDLIHINKSTHEYADNDPDPTVKDEQERTTSTTTLPAFRAGLESRITKWLVGRIGAVQAYTSTKTEQTYADPVREGDETSVSYRDVTFTPTVGLAATVGKFVIDAVFNEGLLFDGPNFVSGAMEPVATQLSVSYKVN